MMSNRTVLGVIGCLVLGDEMAHVLENDPKIENVFIVDNNEGRLFRDKLDPEASGQYIQMVNEEDLRKVELSGHSAVVWVKGASLHDDPSDLLENLASSIHELEPCCGAVLLFYGMCRSTKYDIKRFVERFDLPVMFLCDADGKVVDDCFSAVLGGHERYLDMIMCNKRTMFLTTGYAEHLTSKGESWGLEAMMQQYENYQLLFKNFGYNKAMVLDTGLGDREAFRERTRMFAAMFDLSLEVTRCDTTLFERSYRQAWSMMPLSSLVRGTVKEAVLSRTLP